MLNKTLVLCVLLVAPISSDAQSVRYISDNLEVPLRTGTSTRHKIVRMLSSGTPVEVLQTGAENGYQLIRVGNIQGWVLSRYLMDTPNAEAALEQVKGENTRLQEQLDALAGEINEARARYREVDEARQHLSQELAQIRKAAANVIAIDEQNRQLQEQVVKLERQLQILRQENQSLVDDSTQNWFLLGSLVLLSGIILGLVLPRLRAQRRDGWGEL